MSQLTTPIMRRSGAIRALATAILWSVASVAFSAPDLRILIDVSGSMRENDPQDLRKPALDVLNELLPAGATAGVWTFAEKTEVLAKPGAVDDSWKSGTRSRLDRIHSRGLFTDIERAIDAAIQGWEKSEDADRHVILLTDGIVDVSKDAAQSAASRERILSQQIPRLQALHAKVHTIALSDHVDKKLMHLLSGKTDGWLESARDAGALQRIFLHMLEQAAAPTTVPIKGNAFEIDDQVSEFTLLAFRNAGGHSTLVSPDGKTISADKPDSGTAWRSETGYDLVTLTNPAPGTWKLRGVSDPDNRVVVVTDLGIELGKLPATLRAGDPLPVESRMTDHQRPVTRMDLLQLVTATLDLSGDDQSAATKPHESHEPTPAKGSHSEPAADGHGPAKEADTKDGHAPAEPSHATQADSHDGHAGSAQHHESGSPAKPDHGEAGHTVPGHGQSEQAAPEQAESGHTSAPDGHGQAHPPAETPASPIGVSAMKLDRKTQSFKVELDSSGLSPGVYQVVAVIDGGTFKRQVIKRIKVLGPPISMRHERQLPSPEHPAAAFAVSLTAEQGALDPKTLNGYLLLKGPPGHDSVVDLPAKARLPLTVKFPIKVPGDYQVRGHLSARTPDGEAIDVNPITEKVNFTFEAQEADSGHDGAGETPGATVPWLPLTLYLLGGNAVLGLALGLTWWLMKRKKNVIKAAAKASAKAKAKDTKGKRK